MLSSKTIGKPSPGGDSTASMLPGVSASSMETGLWTGAGKSQQKQPKKLAMTRPGKFAGTKKNGRRGSEVSWLGVGRENLLVVATIAAVLLGSLAGIGTRVFVLGEGERLSPRTISLIAFPGEILMHMLKMIVIPLIVSSLIAGLARLDARQSGRIGSLTVGYYMSTTVIAVITGVILVLLVQPGHRHPSAVQQPRHALMAPGGSGSGTAHSMEKRPDTLDAMLDLVRNMFPENVLQSALQHQQTQYASVQHVSQGQVTVEYRPKVVYKDGMNIIGLIVFSMGFGIVLGQMGDAGRPLVAFFAAFEQVIMRLVKTIMWFSPVGIASLITGKILELEDVAGTVQSLALFTATVVGGQSFHLLVSLPLLYYALTRDNPYRFMRGLIQAWTTALGTASSAATLPVTYACMEKNLGIDKRVTRFVLPVGATINMDGTALYEAVAAIFIAEMNGMQLGLGQILTVSLTATLASIGAASIPHGGFVMLVLVLSAIGLPAQDVSLVVAVDWFIDRFRTAVNVLGDAFGAGIVHHFTKDQLDAVEEDDYERFSSEEENNLRRRSSASLLRKMSSPTKTTALTIEINENNEEGEGNVFPKEASGTYRPVPVFEA